MSGDNGSANLDGSRPVPSIFVGVGSELRRSPDDRRIVVRGDAIELIDPTGSRPAPTAVTAPRGTPFGSIGWGSASTILATFVPTPTEL